jgi:hypothetical protein
MTQERGKTAWDLSLRSYCFKEKYPEMLFRDSTITDFKFTKTIYWEEYDIVGYIGYSERKETIYVVYRGTVGELNLALDFEEQLVSYDDTWPECDCRVHKGLNSAVMPRTLMS